MGPVFPSAVHGGSQRTLRDVALHLGAAGHVCHIYCPRRADNAEPFILGPNVTVLPVLRFKETYPEPYYAPPYQLRDVINTLRRALDAADAFYIHDGELLYHFLYDEVPTTVAFQDFVYPDTLAGALSFRRDRLVVTSDYVRRCVLAVFGEFTRIDSADLRVIPNGFDLDEFRAVSSTALRQSLGLRPDDIPILYPHRPDPRKGLHEAIQAVSLAADRLGEPTRGRLKLLFPRWMDSDIVGEGDHIYQSIYAQARAAAEACGISEALVIHDWMPAERMAAYYSLGVATLCIGNFIEAFGNVSVESELCGTPAIVSRVAAQREVLPRSLCSKVDFGDVSAAAELIAEYVDGRPARTDEVRKFVQEAYPRAVTVDRYAEAITTCAVRAGLPGERPSRLSMSDLLGIPPWCAALERGYYNDYAYRYTEDSRLLSLARRGDWPMRVGGVIERGISFDEVENWFSEGWIVRVAGTAESSHVR
jgi:glycosyltransferase involved in cell wall biosynthesis